MFAVDYSNERSQQSFNVLAAVVAELDEKMKQSQYLHTYICTLIVHNFNYDATNNKKPSCR